MKTLKTSSAWWLGRFIILFLLLSFCGSLTYAQAVPSFSSFLNPDCATQEKRDNEFTHDGRPDGNFFCNPLTLGGASFDYYKFSLESKGELRLIKGEAMSGSVVEIPFYLHLRRKGVLVTHPGDGIIFSKIEISTILKEAKDDDELIIEPVKKEDWPAKRIVQIGNGC
jgi:hypothetical protein